MSNGVDTRLGRRGFLKGVAIAAGASPLERHLFAASGAVTAAGITQSGSAHAAGAVSATVSELPAPAAGYESLSPDEAGFVEAMVNVMCPPDHLTPNGVDCGLATYIDRQLAGGYGTGELLICATPGSRGSRSSSSRLGSRPRTKPRGRSSARDLSRSRSKPRTRVTSSATGDLSNTAHRRPPFNRLPRQAACECHCRATDSARYHEIDRSVSLSTLSQWEGLRRNP